VSGADRFYRAIKDIDKLSDKEVVGYFAYYVTAERGDAVASTEAIKACFGECDLAPPPRTAVYLSEGLNEKRYIKVDGGYKLHRDYKEKIARQLGASRSVTQASAELRTLEAKLAPGPKKEFLKETLDCFETGANRATIVMCWILALDHLHNYVFQHRLAAFNSVLAANTDRRVKISRVQNREDFGDIPEGKFIEFLRSAGIISNDIRKILDEKLGIRNSSAHPSAIAIKASKVVEFVDDLVENIILKFKIPENN
jgi:hypothetical protein